jgi:uncharacterized protein (DUF488 family)
VLIYTIGHSNRPLEEFLNMLRAHDIAQLIDVRTAAGSRRNPQFGKSELSLALEAEGTRYLHLPELGGFRKPRIDSRNTGWRNASFRGFADYMETPQFEAGITRLLEVAEARTASIMCSEAVPWRCHRSLIADALTVRGQEVRHIMSANKADEHRLTPFAKVDGTEIWYPPEAGTMLEAGKITTG